jgi:Ni,Fe-hydrogenase III large subunit
MTDPRSAFTPVFNSVAIPQHQVAALEMDSFHAGVLEGVEKGWRVVSYFGRALPGPAGVELVAVLADDFNGELRAARTRVQGDTFPSLTPRCPQVHLFEREIAEQMGLRPEGHPWLKPVRFARALRAGHDAWGRDPAAVPPIGVMDFYRVDGEAVHEVAVGPVHAGVIEPGHFRFQCHGEEVFHLEISLGYQYRGIEEHLIGGPDKLTLKQMETVAGDSSIAHSTAYCQALEGLSGATASARAHVIRAVALELERLANHTGDLGALAGDIGFQPTLSFCGRIRGDFLNLSALLCGSRFGRGLVRPGGVRFDLSPAQADDLLRGLDVARREVTAAVEPLWTTPSVLARFEYIGPVTPEQCLDLGLVGPPARACGLERDARTQHPAGVFQFTTIPLVTAHHGDVNSRAFVRWLEIQRSLDYLDERLRHLPTAGRAVPAAAPAALAPDSLVVSLVEGWRGEVCHVALTDGQGRFARYKITDPSFHNWMGLALALRGQQISDFPLCNKSFNLSYCGFDL